MLKVIIKTKDHKQAKLSKKERISSQKNFDIIDLDIIKGKKILIVDDVYTTGSSMRAAIELCKRGNPKKIEVLVMSKNILKEKK